MLRALIVALTLCHAQAADSQSPARFSFNWVTNGAHHVSLCGSNIASILPRSSDWSQAFQVHVEPDDLRSSIGLPPINGRYSLKAECVEFHPQFPFQPGVRYRATLRPPGGQHLSSVFLIPVPQRKPTTVITEIYPTADVLPENLLKFYIYFSSSMSGGHIYEHIQLTDELDEPVELPFLEIDEELWNPGMTRLTLFLDPGRIKRGVKPLEDVGPALEENKRYTLTIASSWLDANGTPLKEAFQKRFRVTASDREAPDLALWKVTVPKAGTHDPLKIEFSDPMDHALALRMIRVANVPGKPTLTNKETLWSFVPDEPWRTGKQQLLVQTTIEDLAGNNIGKPFEVDLFSSVQKRITHDVATREFTIE
jgi:hypothetical protein